MKRIAYVLVAGALLLYCSGCATVAMRSDLSGSKPKGLYPATRADVSGAIRYCRNDLIPFGFWVDSSGRHPSIVEKFFWCAFCTIDVPISLVTDTVCFPWDLAEKNKNTGLQQRSP